jgi:hypothetical protein
MKSTGLFVVATFPSDTDGRTLFTSTAEAAPPRRRTSPHPFNRTRPDKVPR